MSISNPLRRVVVGVGFTLGALLGASAVQAQPPSSKSPEGASVSASLDSKAYLHYLLALRYAGDGIPYAALHEAAASLRIEREKNPAAGLAFQLIEEQRQNTHVRLCCIAAKILTAQYSPDGTRIMTVLEDRTIRIWNAASGQQIFAPMQHGGEILAAVWSADGTRIASSSDDGKVHLWDAKTGKPVRAPFTLEKPLAHLALNPHGDRILGSQAGALYLLNAEKGDIVTPKPVYHDDISVVSFSNDGKYALIATNDDVADIVDAVTAKRLHRLPLGNAVFSGSFSNDSQYALTGSEDHTARIWNASSGAQGTGFVHSAAVSDAEFSRDGKLVLTASYDHTAQVWDAVTGRAVTPLLQHRAPVINGGFSFDGRFAFTRSRDHQVNVWDVAAGELAMLPIRDAGSLTNAAMSPTEAELLVGIDEIAEIHDLPPNEIPPVWLADLADFEASRSRFDQAGIQNRPVIEKLQKELLSSSSTDRWTQFGKWYFTAAAQRTISPWSKIALHTYVESLLQLDTKESLAYAKQLSVAHPDWLLKIAEREKVNASKQE